MSTIRTTNEGNINDIFICEKCDYTCRDKYNYKRHLATAKHRIRTELEHLPRNEGNTTFVCITCNCMFKSQSDLSIHMITEKHGNEGNEGNEGNDDTNRKYMCKCGKPYASRSSLWYHKKRCQVNIDFPEEPEKVNRVLPVSHTFAVEPDDTSMETMLFTLLKEQAERSNKLEEHAYKMEERLAEQMATQAEAAAEQNRLMIEAISLKGPQCITNNNNTTNNQFNLNVFLNEDCKDAFTLKEVVDSIECTVMDLDRMDKDGYVATITRKILESIQNMSITERPIHCTDARRNTVCVKSKEGWDQNEAAIKRLNDTVYRMGGKLGSVVEEWRIAYPDHFRGTVSRREQYHRLVSDIIKINDLDVEARIASKICKGVILDRKAAKA